MIGMVLHCYSLMESINSKYSGQALGLNPNFESAVRGELGQIEAQVNDAEDKYQELKQAGGAANEDERISHKNR